MGDNTATLSPSVQALYWMSAYTESWYCQWQQQRCLNVSNTRSCWKSWLVSNAVLSVDAHGLTHKLMKSMRTICNTLQCRWYYSNGFSTSIAKSQTKPSQKILCILPGNKVNHMKENRGAEVWVGSEERQKEASEKESRRDLEAERWRAGCHGMGQRMDAARAGIADYEGTIWTL